MKLDGPRPGLCWPLPLDRTGDFGPTVAQGRGPFWRRTSRGFYVPVTVELNPEQRIVEAATVLPDRGGAQGWAALRWMGGQWFDGIRGGELLPVVLATDLWDLRRQAGFVVSHERLLPGEVETTDEVRHTTAVVATCFEMRRAGSPGAAARILDLACYDDLVSIEEMAIHLTAHTGQWRGLGCAVAALPLAEENCWSPPEHDTRMTWRSAGLPPVLSNRPVFDLTGRRIGTPDLMEPRSGTAVQYDSAAIHGRLRTRRRDRDTIEALREVGIATVTVMTGDNPADIVARMVAVHAQQSTRPAGPRRWTLDPPPWWLPGFTVEQRRAMTPAQRERWLGYRRLSGGEDDVRGRDSA